MSVQIANLHCFPNLLCPVCMHSRKARPANTQDQCCETIAAHACVGRQAECLTMHKGTAVTFHAFPRMYVLAEMMELPKQVSPAEPLKLLEGVFIFSLIWSIGATTETAGRTLFNLFLRKLLKKSVEESPDRTEFDLGPGVTITPPEFDLRPVLPVVRFHDLTI